VGGKDTPMEVHLVHKDAQGKLAVVGVLIDAGAKSEAAGAIWSAIPAKAGAEQALSAPIDPAAFVPKDPRTLPLLRLAHDPPAAAKASTGP
jgi:carbonic anhydrase